MKNSLHDLYLRFLLNQQATVRKHNNVDGKSSAYFASSLNLGTYLIKDKRHTNEYLNFKFKNARFNILIDKSFF